jgi:hypothetical protein
VRDEELPFVFRRLGPFLARPDLQKSAARRAFRAPARATTDKKR